jgi:hypothetical protein
MFQTTRFSRWFAIALLALASFGAPAVSAQTCCFVPNYRPAAPKAQQVYRINGVNYPVDDSGWIWQRNPYGPWVVVGHLLATPNGYVALMHAGGQRYRAIRVA